MSRERQFLIACLVLFVARAVLAASIVPPWQGPDDPVHFSVSYLMASPRPGLTQVDAEKEILTSMARYRWWDPYDTPVPDPLPTTFQQVARLGRGQISQFLYYRLGAGWLRATRASGLEGAFWRLRALSVLLSVMAVLLAWAGTRLLFGDTVAMGATAIASLHPQFLLASITVNPDALLNVFGAFIWWQVARVVTGHSRHVAIPLIIAAALLAPFIKRSGAPVAGISLLFAAGSLVTVKMTRRMLLMVLSTVAVGVAIALAAWILFEKPLTELAMFWRNALDLRREPERTSLTDAVVFTRVAIDYVWLVAGWLRLPAPEPWLWCARVLTVFGFGSAAVVTLRSPLLRARLLLAWLFVIGHCAATLIFSFYTLVAPQGRLFFPVLAPALALLWVGLTEGVPVRLRAWAPVAALSVIALMDVTGFTTVLMPAYLPWG